MMAGEMLKSPENPKATSTLVLPVFDDGEQYGYANQAIPTNTGPNMTTLDHSQHSTELIGQSYEEDGKGNSDEEPDEEDVSDVDDYLQVRGQESIIIGDTIHYWLTINTWGDDLTMRHLTVVKILSPKEMYNPHLLLSNGDAVNFGDKICQVEERFSEDGLTKQFVNMPWRTSNFYDYSPSVDEIA